jgi:hypothetical protein
MQAGQSNFLETARIPGKSLQRKQHSISGRCAVLQDVFSFVVTTVPMERQTSQPTIKKVVWMSHI